MKKSVVIAAWIGIAAIIGCGGGGASRTELSGTSRAVQGLQTHSLRSFANSGLFLNGFFLWGGGGVGTSGGSGGGYPAMGTFVRGFVGGSTGSTGEGGTSGSTSSGGGGGQGDSFYYDWWLELWVDSQWNANSYSMTFYQDQAKTQPAGFSLFSTSGDWDSFPLTYTSEYAYTAGTLAGASGTYRSTFLSETEGSMSYENSYADGSSDSGESSWTAELATWESEWTSSSGVWYRDSGTWDASGAGTYHSSTSEGWEAAWTYNADWSGFATFNGPDPKLPAQMTWTSAGRFRIVYADGSVEQWDWDDVWGGDGAVGTTGSTGGG